MFHRVKSETPESKKQNEHNIAQDNAVEARAFHSKGPLTGNIRDVTESGREDLEGSSSHQPYSRIEESQEQVEERAPVSHRDVRETNTQGSVHPPYQPLQQQKEVEEMSENETQTPETETTEAQADIPVSSYQRAGVTPPNVAGYPGASSSYPGYGAAAKAAASSSSDRRLTIGAGITMSGEIEACDYLLVEGTVEAALKGASVLDVAETGVFYGTVEIEDATIAGRFEGDITAHGRLTLREGAIVTGTIAYKELEIEAGAVIDGKLTPLNAVASAKKQPEPEATQARPAPKKEAPKPAAAPKAVKEPADVTPAPANAVGGGLFSKATTAAE